ncbi:hypothetical protein [Streptomyces sp. NPDC095613]|uniref:WXG100 family type VII secretion target n=1 Tax=Streptomyces sp. NPDC095613 TaxID=3155540 RepID=UPI00331AA455
MGEQVGGEPGETPFDSMTHAELRALLSPASKETAMALAEKLEKAAQKISEIGEDLKTRVSILRWEGDAGQSFREWGDQTANATINLASYTHNASKWMTQVTQAIAEAHQNMPPASETEDAEESLRTARENYTAATTGPGKKDTDARTVATTSRTDMTSAQASIDATRAEAARQLRKLAQTYVLSANQVNKEPVPTFPPPAMYMGQDWVMPESYKSVPGQTYSGGTSSVGGVAYARGGGGGGSSDSDYVVPGGIDGVGRAVGGVTVPSQTPVSMEIDGITTLPDAPTNSPTTPVTNQPVARPETTVPTPGLIPPTFRGSAPPVPGLPGNMRPVTGAVRNPALPGGGLNSRAPLARETGIVGGRPVPPNSGRPAGGIPRGTVVGGETAQGRTPMGRGMTPGMPGGGGGGGQGGLTGGRRLASESGGVVGGRNQRPGTNPGRAFTPGGSGLIRGGRGPVRARDEEEQSGERPDYLVEDEETWQQGSRRIVPPVVD